MTTLVAITGNTYPVKDQLKALGGKWNPDTKSWEVPSDKAEEAKKIVEAGSDKPQEKRRFVHHKCVVCGVKADRYTPIYRSGECRDCYEERKMGY